MVALSFNYVEPTLTEGENKIIIKNGRYESKKIFVKTQVAKVE
jgi:hypothetical protein